MNLLEGKIPNNPLKQNRKFILSRDDLSAPFIAYPALTWLQLVF